jgi:hypothetical protein
VAEQNAQSIVTVQNKFTRQRTFRNAQRTAKPQTFTAGGSAALHDPTVGKGCDFCDWHNLTAQDAWGRVENEHCVTASNLFKIAGNHGLVLFKHHQPLEFTEEQLGSLLAAAQSWVHATHAASPSERWPLLMWNCGPRSGASQFHGHAQILLTKAALPDIERRHQGAAAFASAHDMAPATADVDDGESSDGGNARTVAAFERACAEAHAALGLRRVLRVNANDEAWAYAEVQPLKDCDTIVLGTAPDSPAFVRMLHLAMRTLIDRCGVVTFNAAVTGLSLSPQEDAARRSGVHSSPQAVGCVVARVVSRGKVSSAASDYGALEVFSSASIGHTSPWRVMQQLDAEAAQRGVLLLSGED